MKILIEEGDNVLLTDGTQGEVSFTNKDYNQIYVNDTYHYVWDIREVNNFSFDADLFTI